MLNEICREMRCKQMQRQTVQYANAKQHARKAKRIKDHAKRKASVQARGILTLSVTSRLQHIHLLLRRPCWCLSNRESLVFLPHRTGTLIRRFFDRRSRGRVRLGCFLSSTARWGLCHVSWRNYSLRTIWKWSQRYLPCSIIPKLACQHVRLAPSELV